MIVTYDPKTQGRELSKEEIQHLKDLKPHFTAFDVDNPELTDELIRRIKEAPRGHHIDKKNNE